MQQSLAEQADWLRESGSLWVSGESQVLLAVGESLGNRMKKLSAKPGSPAEGGRKKIEVFPYFHKTSHGLKKSGPKIWCTYGVRCSP